MNKIAIKITCLAIIATSLAMFACTDKTEDETEVGLINGHEYVDLGLSVKWATCNVGATSATDTGHYYAWGELETKSDYTYANCTTFGKQMGDISANPLVDVANAKWGGPWRMPTKTEFEELINNCSWKWMKNGNTYGYLITGVNENTIFLPAGGWKTGASTLRVDENGYYWTSTPDEEDVERSFYLNFMTGDRNISCCRRYDGMQIRPVAE